jgi:hypothetical protein
MMSCRVSQAEARLDLSTPVWAEFVTPVVLNISGTCCTPSHVHDMHTFQIEKNVLVSCK